MLIKKVNDDDFSNYDQYFIFLLYLRIIKVAKMQKSGGYSTEKMSFSGYKTVVALYLPSKTTFFPKTKLKYQTLYLTNFFSEVPAVSKCCNNFIKKTVF